ncbi:ComEA family DNA-binding protein [Flavobacterium alkalisoli]|uniref:ComEA family DNA-binding protein n=1 Tax=Flavobacterium alkalisoli TaxID=2602769 RepID=UPI003A8F8E95
MKKPFGFFLRFTKGQRKGVMALLFLIIIFQAGYFIFTSFGFSGNKEVSPEEAEWLSHQEEIDKLKEAKSVKKDTIFPFNPNFISDYKAYILGLNEEQLYKLTAFRKTGAYVNSSEEFKGVTGIHDTLLIKLKPYLRFSQKPDVMVSKGEAKEKHVKEEEFKVIDINIATSEQLQAVYGIGPYYAKCIVEKREQLGGYVNMNQLDDFGDVPANSLHDIYDRFAVITQPEVNTINVNTASLHQLSRFPYFNKDLARAIITQRSMLGNFSKIEDLLEINGFPVEKEKIIALYLEF